MVTRSILLHIDDSQLGPESITWDAAFLLNMQHACVTTHKPPRPGSSLIVIQFSTRELPDRFSFRPGSSLIAIDNLGIPGSIWELLNRNLGAP